MKSFANEDIWATIKESIRPRISRDGFERWFSGLEFLSDDGAEIVLTVPNPMHQFFLESNYLPLIRATLVESLGTSERKVRIIAPLTEEEAATEMHKASPTAESNPSATTQTTPSSTSKENIEATLRSVKAAGLNERNTFDSFVVGANNHLAYSAAQAVASNLGRIYNPLLFFGKSGLGKTHLLHAIGHQVLANKKNAKVVYTTSEQFTNEFIDAIRDKTLDKFRRRYRQIDVLMIDDIQFFAGKSGTQEEFFHTFNTLHDGHKHIILSSDRPPNEISSLEQRLVSRFVWGMASEIFAPDTEVRIAILRKKAAGIRFAPPDWVFEFLAERIRNNVRNLEGSLARIAAYHSLSSSEITTDTIETLCRDIFQEQVRKAVTIDQIQRKVAEHFDIRVSDMTSKRRPANIAFPRQVAMFLSREHTPSSLMDIGEAFGGRDHGTIIHAVKLVKQRIEHDEKIRLAVKTLASQLQT